MTALAEVNSESSPGHDNISFLQIQRAGNEMKEKVLDIFNGIWASGDIPDDWKLSSIVPIPKAGRDPLTAEGYRPIALTSYRLYRLY